MESSPSTGARAADVHEPAARLCRTATTTEVVTLVCCLDYQRPIRAKAELGGAPWNFAADGIEIGYDAYVRASLPCCSRKVHAVSQLVDRLICVLPRYACQDIGNTTVSPGYRPFGTL